ncbi:hypothetical protein [Burkholderia ubonensis]|uniref:hypothetical protein n=1 Tax=Burkholderia ubonensis TaxID=101571 RepID=UPI0007598CD9|nr:hypothetical protein [Burkholderia ubonensis]KWB50906.1 hypothetical protein WL36_05035 [Burkholderia ubonensis]
MFCDYYLRGADERALFAVLAAAGLIRAARPQEGGLENCALAPGVLLDWIGVLYDADSKPLYGWHANLRLDRQLKRGERAALRDVLIEPPATPQRIWA